MNRASTKYIIIACTKTDPRLKFKNELIGFRWLDLQHRKLGMFGVGFHYVILLDGQVIPGRPLAASGVHSRGYNECSVGICLVGGGGSCGKPEDNYTSPQLGALCDVLEDLSEKYPGATVVGQNQLGIDSRSPAFDVPWWLTKCDLLQKLKLKTRPKTPRHNIEDPQIEP